MLTRYKMQDILRYGMSVCCMFILFVIIIVHSETLLQAKKEIRNMNVKTIPSIIKSNATGMGMAEKWIVVTTVQRPTTDVIKMSKIPGWKLVVVGDFSTPKDWSLPGVAFLSVDHQKLLGYRITNMLPYKSYTRKAIGYLYAIQHGAKYIYDTDDDNSPSQALNETFILGNKKISIMMIDTNYTTYNPYPHFGQSTLWPRGYPLERVGLPQPRQYRMCKMDTPPIQQGLVDGDPDVDAVFRMTRRASSKPLDLRFDRKAPPVAVPPKSFSPFNSQNTLFTYKAFWGMILPATVTFRATDIYRGYWAQYFLQFINGALVFLPPNAVQKRNIHSDFADYLQEEELYKKVGSFTEWLGKAECIGVSNLFNCISTTTKALVEKQMWSSEDYDLVVAWLDDLQSVGYQVPDMVDNGRNFLCSDETAEFIPVEQLTSLPHTSEYLQV